MEKEKKLWAFRLALFLLVAAFPLTSAAKAPAASPDDKLTATQAADPVYKLVLWLKSGEQTSYLFSERPHFSLVEGKIEFATDQVSFTLEPADFDCFTLEQEAPAPPPSNYRLYVWLKDGSKAAFPFDEKPLVTVGTEVFTLTTLTQTVEYEAADILKFTIGDADDVPTAVSQPELSKTEMYLRDGKATLSSTRPGSKVRVYDSSGRQILSLTADSEGVVAIPVADCPQGIYIIKTETTTIKIQKK